ncbi:MAG TPA: hypothetical protein VF006_07060 [Longimicrobium sp.]
MDLDPDGLPPGARERIRAEFAPEDRSAVEAIFAGYVRANRAESAGVWQEVLDCAGGSVDRLLEAIILAQTDWRDVKVWAARQACFLSLLGRPAVRRMPLGGEEEAAIRREFEANRRLAARCFPPEQVDEEMLRMGPHWPVPAEEVLHLARGDDARLRLLLDGRPAAEADPSVPAPLADLPLAAAEVIRRDFAPDTWDAAARVASGVEPARGLQAVLDWLLLAEYAAGDPAALADAVRLRRERELVRSVALRRWEKQYGSLTRGA